MTQAFTKVEGSLARQTFEDTEIEDDTDNYNEAKCVGQLLPAPVPHHTSKFGETLAIRTISLI